MFTIPQIDEIASQATERIEKEFAESGFKNPPVVSHGIVRVVLEAAEHLNAGDGACAWCVRAADPNCLSVTACPFHNTPRA